MCGDGTAGHWLGARAARPLQARSTTLCFPAAEPAALPAAWRRTIPAASIHSETMIFNTWIYGFFLLLTVAAYWSSPARFRPFLLTAFGFYFYWYYYPPHVILIGAMTLLVFALSWWIQPHGARRRRLWFVLGVGGCLGALTYYKYQGFLFDSLAWVTTPMGLPARFQPPQLQPPLAISFFTFEFVHYLIEIFRGSFAPGSLRDFMLFIMFFPTLVCGPIKRFQQFNPQEHIAQRFDAADFNYGLERILFGIAKKTLIADTLAPWCSPVFADPASYTWGQLWLAVYGYAMQIYFDFSGYSDIAIGSARMFGYTVQENFNYPYLRTNVAQFWRNWHMSLTSWITDYVYIPLGGNRRGERRAQWNRLVAMTLCGLWHGAAFHFAVWGMYHGIGLNIYRAYAAARTRLTGRAGGFGNPASRLVAGLVTFHFVCIGWVLFVCELDKAWPIILRLLLIRA
jgi:alginate O-acetyltransferase complex protein AlgI